MKHEIDPFFAKEEKEIKRICEELEIKKLYFFGSSIDGRFIQGKSDLDILVDTDEKRIKNIVRLKIKLQQLFNCAVDAFHTRWKISGELEEYLKTNKVLVYQKEH